MRIVILLLQNVLGKATKVMKLAVQAASQKGASSWITSIPTYSHNTILHKNDFVDAIYIRYGWDLLNIPLECKCHAKFSLQHALDCKLGGLRVIQHNEARDTMAQFMREAGFTSVETEPKLQPLSGETFIYKSAIIRTKRREVTLSATVFISICDMRSLILRWFHLMQEAMRI